MTEESKKTWLDGIVGWEPMPSMETCWIDDPAVDSEASDYAKFYETLDKKYLKVKEGMTPQKIIIALPDPTMIGNIQPHMSHHISACIVAFELCVRFPGVASAAQEYREGFARLNEKFMSALVKHQNQMVQHVGMWILLKCFLNDTEKKTLSSESMAKTLENSESTIVTSATLDDNA
jgi:hypothetical protein